MLPKLKQNKQKIFETPNNKSTDHDEDGEDNGQGRIATADCPTQAKGLCLHRRYPPALMTPPIMTAPMVIEVEPLALMIRVMVMPEEP